MTELGGKQCVVSNLRTRDLVVVLFPCKEDPHLFVELKIGEKGLAAVDIFSLQIAIVEALHYNHLQLKRGTNNQHLMFSQCCRWETIEAKLTEIIRSCAGYCYEDCCKKLRQHFDWEYEGMR